MQVKVKITETFERIVTVKTKTKTDAVVKVTNEYLDGKSMLDENGLVHFKVELYEDEQKKTKKKENKKC